MPSGMIGRIFPYMMNEHFVYLNLKGGVCLLSFLSDKPIIPIVKML